MKIERAMIMIASFLAGLFLGGVYGKLTIPPGSGLAGATTLLVNMSVGAVIGLPAGYFLVRRFAEKHGKVLLLTLLIVAALAATTVLLLPNPSGPQSLINVIALSILLS